MRWCRVSFCQLLLVAVFAVVQLTTLSLYGETSDSQKNLHEQKVLANAQQYEKAHQFVAAIDAYKKANKIADGQCVQCLTKLSELYRKTGDNKKSAEAAAQLEQIVSAPADKAQAAILQGAAWLREGMKHKKHELLAQADAQFHRALQLQPDDIDAVYLDGMTLGRMGNDADAHAAFAKCAASKTLDPIFRARALRYLTDPALVRAQMAPGFSIRTLQGNTLSLDDLQGKVVLIDFWATWCGPCNEELPHVKKIASQFEGKPFVVLSISLDHDPEKWQAFVEKNNMTWPQYRDSDGEMASVFGVQLIPNYFTIDSDGVLRAENLGGDSIDGRLKKLVAAAQIKDQQASAAVNHLH